MRKVGVFSFCSAKAQVLTENKPDLQIPYLFVNAAKFQECLGTNGLFWDLCKSEDTYLLHEVVINDTLQASKYFKVFCKI